MKKKEHTYTHTSEKEGRKKDSRCTSWRNVCCMLCETRIIYDRGKRGTNEYDWDVPFLSIWYFCYAERALLPTMLHAVRTSSTYRSSLLSPSMYSYWRGNERAKAARQDYFFFMPKNLHVMYVTVLLPTPLWKRQVSSERRLATTTDKTITKKSNQP